jgi:hypothetical protein
VRWCAKEVTSLARGMDRIADPIMLPSRSGGSFCIAGAHAPRHHGISRLRHFFLLCAVDGFSACSAGISPPLSSM